MKFFSSLKNQATGFLEQYRVNSPATYAVAQQAIGAVLIADGLFGIDNPLGGKKRPGIFGTISRIILGVVFMLVPTFANNITNVKNMTAMTSAEVVSISYASESGPDGTVSRSCSFMASYTVDGREYRRQSLMSSSSYCSLSEGQLIDINYDPSNPGSWIYDVKSFSMVLGIFFWIGLIFLVSSIVTFAIRLVSIVFGWKLLRAGRKNASNLPEGINLQAMIVEIKQNFIGSVFGFGRPAASPVNANQNVHMASEQDQENQSDGNMQ